MLTRSDYIRYEDERLALRGTLHQTLLERELLVVGFSMTDDNVHVIIDNVRQAIDDDGMLTETSDAIPEKSFGAERSSSAALLTSKRSASGALAYKQRLRDGEQFSMGTILSMVENNMFRKLWANDFTVVSSAQSWTDDPAWLHDCFLDMLCSGIVQSRAQDSFILDPAYERLLDDNQRKIREALQPLRELADNEAVRASPSWNRIERLLNIYGERNDNSGFEHTFTRMALSSRLSA